MYRFIFAFLFNFLIGFYIHGQVKDNLAIVKLNLNDNKEPRIILFKTVEGNKVEYASVQNNGSKEVAFAVPVPEEGFYYLSDQTGWWFVRIYLKPGDRLDLSIHKSGMYEVLFGSLENKVLQKWFMQVADVVLPSNNRMDTTTYLAFYSRANEMLKRVERGKKKAQTTNARFNQLFNLLTDIEVEYASLLYCFSPHQLQPPLDTLKSFLKQFLGSPKYCNAQLLALGEGVGLLRLYVTANYVMLDDAERMAMLNDIEKTTSLFCNDTLKGAYIVSRFPNFKFYDEFISKVTPVKHLIVTDYQQELFDRKLKSMDSALSKGRPSYNFSFPDTSGAFVTMKDFTGKVVLIDAWATWCKPCLQEIPSLKKLERELSDKNVAFVSISFDEMESKEKWRHYVRDENLGSNQLFAAGFKHGMAEFYKISEIPRFLLFDQAGKIVSINAPRPSDPQLKSLIEGLISPQK